MALIKIIIIATILALTSLTFDNSSAEQMDSGFDHTHSDFDKLLREYVKDGRVDYKGFINSKEAFDQYLEKLGDGDINLTGRSDDERLAFWINAYNAFTIKAIIDNYPIKKSAFFSLFPSNSIRQIDGVWDKLTFKAAGKTVSLNQIEHEIIRKEFSEPRIHFSIVCASVGCPQLRSEAYRAEALDRQLEEAAAAFVNDPDKTLIDADKREVKLSKIFKWFGTDFVDEYSTQDYFKERNPKDRAVLNFIRKRLSNDADKNFIESKRFSISYLKYDWSLNE